MGDVTLTDFLLARIAERERVVQKIVEHDAWRGIGVDSITAVATHINLHDPAWVIADCETKRRILHIHHPYDHHGEHGGYVFCSACQWDHGDESPRIDMGIEEFGKPCPTLRLLAMPYADHSDYCEEWRV